MRQVCSDSRSSISFSQLKPATRILADDNHGILYCWMSKVACTSFKMLFLRASGKAPRNLARANVHNIPLLASSNLPLFYRLNVEEQEQRIRDYFSFMNVRHPFERLISVYKDKILQLDTDLPMIVVNVLKKRRPVVFKDPQMNLSLHANKREFARYARQKHTPTFKEFAEWFALANISNDHWRTVQASCHPCSMDWNAVLRIETMQSNSSVVLSKLASDLENLTQVPVKHSNQALTDRQTAFSHTYKILVNYTDVAAWATSKILDYYEMDMDMFGYKWDDQTHTAFCSIETKDGYCC